MKRSWLSKISISLIFISLGCSGGNGKIHHSATLPVHDTVNRKAEIKNPARDQQRLDSIKAEKTRKKK